MNPNPLESAFEPVKRANPQDAARLDSEIQNFNDFFARLSTLDDISLSPQNSDAERRPPPASAKTAPKPAESKGTPSGRMQVMRSHRTVPPENPVPLMPRPATAGAAANATPGSRIGTVLRVLLAGLVLFAVGLGAMWGALSLPGQFAQGKNPWQMLVDAKNAPSPSNTLQDVGGMLDQKSQGSDAVVTHSPDEEAEQDRQESIAAATLLEPSKAKTVTMAPTKTAAKASARAKPRAEPAPKVAAAMLPGMIAPQADTSESVSMETTAATVSDRYALQVGACGSDDCVRKYRTLLEGSVKPDSIRVVSQLQGTRTVQRIRISPLERSEAERMKDSLTQSDPRFKDAYVVKLK